MALSPTTSRFPLPSLELVEIPAALRDLLHTVDHVGILAESIDAGAAPYAHLGLPVVDQETLTIHGVQVAFIDLPTGSSIELLAPLEPGSKIAQSLTKRGAGLHHLCFWVDAIESAIATLKSCGVKLIDTEPRPGARGHLVAFAHPSSFGGVLVELCQHR